MNSLVMRKQYELTHCQGHLEMALNPSSDHADEQRSNHKCRDRGHRNSWSVHCFIGRDTTPSLNISHFIYSHNISYKFSTYLDETWQLHCHPCIDNMRISIGGDDPQYPPIKQVGNCPWPLCSFIFLFQTRCRQFLARLHYSRTKKAAITTQCAWRGKVARKELRKLKMVSSSTLGSRQLWCCTMVISVGCAYFSCQFLSILLFIRLPGKLVPCKRLKTNLKSKLKSLHGGYSWRSAWEWVYIVTFATKYVIWSMFRHLDSTILFYMLLSPVFILLNFLLMTLPEKDAGHTICTVVTEFLIQQTNLVVYLGGCLICKMCRFVESFWGHILYLRHPCFL